MEDLRSEFPTMYVLYCRVDSTVLFPSLNCMGVEVSLACACRFLKPGVAQKAMPKHGESVNMKGLQFIDSQKCMWGCYGQKNGSAAQVSSTRWS